MRASVSNKAQRGLGFQSDMSELLMKLYITDSRSTKK